MKIVGILIFVFILFKLDYGSFWETWLQADLSYLLASSFLILFLNVLHSVKWKCFLDFFSIRQSISRIIAIFWVGMFIGMITPAKIGDLLKVYYLGETGHSRLRGFLSVVTDRLSDLILLLAVGALSAFYVFGWGVDVGQFILIILLVIGITVLALGSDFKLNQFIEGTLRRTVPILADPFRKMSLGNLFLEWKKDDKTPLCVALALLLLCWPIYFYTRFLLVLSLGIPLTFTETTACVSLSALFALLPISVNGIGTREVSMIYLFSLFSVTMEEAIAFSVLILVTDVFWVMLGYIPYCNLSSQFKINLKTDAIKIKESILNQSRA